MLDPAVVAEYQHSLELKSQALQVEAVRIIEKMNQDKNEDEVIQILIERTERIVSSNKQQQATTDRDIERTDSIINSRRAAATEVTQAAARQGLYIRRDNEGQRNNQLTEEAKRSRELGEGIRERASYVDRAHKKLELANEKRCYHLFMRNHWKLKVDETLEDYPGKFTNRQYALLSGFAKKFDVDNKELTKGDLVKRITMDDWKDHQ